MTDATWPGLVMSRVRRAGAATGDLLHRPRVVMTLTLGLLFAGLLVDMTTTQELVVAIIFNIPIAVSGLAHSRRLTTWTIVLALAANVAAAYENALVFSRYDAITLINRGLSALSFLIVGGMTLLRVGAVDQVEHLAVVRRAADRERALRRFATDLGTADDADDLVDRAAPSLRYLLEADALVIATLHGDRFAEPRWADGNAGDLAEPGQLASWAVDAIPTTESPAITVRSERGLITSGRWRRVDTHDLIVVADRPQADKPSVLLCEALHALVPLLERADRQEPVPPDTAEAPQA
jgi:hypothetical protein